jgi:hypothetical protein
MRVGKHNARGSSPTYARKNCMRRRHSGSNNGRTLTRDRRPDNEIFEDLRSATMYPFRDKGQHKSGWRSREVHSHLLSGGDMSIAQKKRMLRRDVRHNSCHGTESLQVGGDDIVGALCATRIDLGGNRVDQCSVRIEGS